MRPRNAYKKVNWKIKPYDIRGSETFPNQRAYERYRRENPLSGPQLLFAVRERRRAKANKKKHGRSQAGKRKDPRIKEKEFLRKGGKIELSFIYQGKEVIAKITSNGGEVTILATSQGNRKLEVKGNTSERASGEHNLGFGITYCDSKGFRNGIKLAEAIWKKAMAL